MPEIHHLVPGQRGDRAIAERIVPRRARSSPVMQRMSVVFPAPFDPRSATISPRVDAEAGAEEHLGVAVGREEVADLKHRRSPGTP